MKTAKNLANFVIKLSNLAVSTKFGIGEALGISSQAFEQPKSFVVEHGSTTHYCQDDF